MKKKTPTLDYSEARQLMEDVADELARAFRYERQEGTPVTWNSTKRWNDYIRILEREEGRFIGLVINKGPSKMEFWLRKNRETDGYAFGSMRSISEPAIKWGAKAYDKYCAMIKRH